MILVLSLVLGILPLAGVAWLLASGMITLWPPAATVDGLFMSLILLTLSACFLLNVYWELRDKGILKKKAAPAAVAKTAAGTAAPAAVKTPAKTT